MSDVQRRVNHLTSRGLPVWKLMDILYQQQQHLADNIVPGIEPGTAAQREHPAELSARDMRLPGGQARAA